MSKSACRWETIPEPLKKIFTYINTNRANFIQNLSDAVAIKSVSADPEVRSEVLKMVHWADGKLRGLGAKTELHELGAENNPTVGHLALPPVLFGTLGNDPKKKTVIIYGHLDVQPAKLEDGWDSEPFTLTMRNCKLYGRGSTDDKGPVLGWFHAIEAFQKTNTEIPVNIKFIFEAMEESGSTGLVELIQKQQGFLKDVNVVCISDNYWLGKNKPCLTYGLRGLCYFTLEVDGGTKDMHSGIFGGAVVEPMVDLIWLMSQLVDVHGNILIPGIQDDVAPVTSKEDSSYATIDFNLEDFKIDAGVHDLRFPTDKKKTLMHRWRYPSLSLHGIQGAFSDPGAKTVIPRKVIGKFSIRIVPNMEPEKVKAQVISYVEKLWEKRNSCNLMKINTLSAGKSWLADYDHANFRAATAATAMVYGVEPDMIREGGTIPITLTLQEFTGKNVLLLPMGASDDGAHSQNEKIDVRNYIEGTKVLAAYLYELGKVAESL